MGQCWGHHPCRHTRTRACRPYHAAKTIHRTGQSPPVKGSWNTYNWHPCRTFLQIRYAAVDALLPPLLLRHLRLLAAMPGLRCSFCKQVGAGSAVDRGLWEGGAHCRHPG